METRLSSLVVSREASSWVTTTEKRSHTQKRSHREVDFNQNLCFSLTYSAKLSRSRLSVHCLLMCPSLDLSLLRLQVSLLHRMILLRISLKRKERWRKRRKTCLTWQERQEWQFERKKLQEMLACIPRQYYRQCRLSFFSWSLSSCRPKKSFVRLTGRQRSSEYSRCCREDARRTRAACSAIVRVLLSCDSSITRRRRRKCFREDHSSSVISVFSSLVPSTHVTMSVFTPSSQTFLLVSLFNN